MKKEQILRLNCPGFGEESYLNQGKAKPLSEYSAIVVNPVSILHVFDCDQEIVQQAEAAQTEGLTSITVRKDDLLETLLQSLRSSEGRLVELVAFLEKGGLLVYFLCRPFLVKGSSLSMDNYFFLESLAPDTPTDNNVRHMSAISQGRNIELTAEGENSPFAPYLKQTGIEWNTIIRSDYLTEGYTALATAGPRKCIAGQLSAGDSGGKIVFLPAPYSPDFDRVLVECIDSWNMKQLGIGTGNQVETPELVLLSSNTSEPLSGRFSPPDPKKFIKSSKAALTEDGALQSEPATDNLPEGSDRQEQTTQENVYVLDSLTTEVSSSTTSCQSEEISSVADGIRAESQMMDGIKESELYILDEIDTSITSGLTAEHLLQSVSDEIEKAASQSSNVVQSTRQTDTSFQEIPIGGKASEHRSDFPNPGEPQFAPTWQSDNNQHDNATVSDAKDLIRKMEGISKTMVPDWCSDYSFPGLDELKIERSELTEQIRQTQAKISVLETRIAVLDGVKNSLLAEEGDSLLNACQKVFKQLNWSSEKSPSSDEELWLSNGKQVEVIARVLRTNAQPKNADLAKLAQSIITYWGEHETEPKGLMIAATWADLPPSKRSQPDFGESLKEFAKKKNLCLMTTMQLLCIYRDLDLGQTTADEVRKKLINTNGLLSGLELEKAISPVGSG